MPTPNEYPDVRPQPYKRDVVDSGNPNVDMRVDSRTGEALGEDIVTDGVFLGRRDYERALNPIERDPARQAPAKRMGTEPLAGAMSGDAKPADQDFADNGDGPDVGGVDGSGGNGNELPGKTDGATGGEDTSGSGAGTDGGTDGGTGGGTTNGYDGTINKTEAGTFENVSNEALFQPETLRSVNAVPGDFVQFVNRDTATSGRFLVDSETTAAWNYVFNDSESSIRLQIFTDETLLRAIPEADLPALFAAEDFVARYVYRSETDNGLALVRVGATNYEASPDQVN